MPVLLDALEAAQEAGCADAVRRAVDILLAALKPLYCRGKQWSSRERQAAEAALATCCLDPRLARRLPRALLKVYGGTHPVLRLLQ